jgi:hypothetical protein
MNSALRHLFILLLAFSSLGPQAGELEPLGPDMWPETKEAAVELALQGLTPEQRVQLKAMEKQKLILLHFGYGTWLRNHLGLWRGNSKLTESVCGGPCHPDNASTSIIEAMWEALQK